MASSSFLQLDGHRSTKVLISYITYIVFRQVYSDYLIDHCLRRRRFKTDLVESLIMPHMMNRQKIPQLHKTKKEAMMRCGLAFSSTSLQTEITLQRRKPCLLCQTFNDKKVPKCCSTCCRPVCSEYSQTSITCNECKE